MPYEPDAQAAEAIAGHMNGDHADDCVLIARAYSGIDTLTRAAIVSVDGAGMDLRAEGAGEPVTVRVPWSGPLADRAAVRVEVVKAYEWARSHLNA